MRSTASNVLIPNGGDWMQYFEAADMVFDTTLPRYPGTEVVGNPIFGMAFSRQAHIELGSVPVPNPLSPEEQQRYLTVVHESLGTVTINQLTGATLLAPTEDRDPSQEVVQNLICSALDTILISRRPMPLQAA